MIAYTAFCIALVAVVYSLILTEPGMLLGGLYQRLQAWTNEKWNKYPEEIYWLKPIVSCSVCVAGQWCFWGYIILYYRSYNVFEHLYFTALGIFLAAILRKVYLWTKI